jgi:hypothetical protein
MKSSHHYLLVLLTVMLGSSLTAQTTNLGVNSGTLGTNNTNVGAYSGNSTIAGGNYNSFFGHSAGRFNTTGDYNSFFGYQAGYSNTTAIMNTFVGMYSGRTNTTGNRNSFLGAYSGYRNTTGLYNVFLGFYSGFNNTTGSNNTFAGYQSGYGNSTGRNNTFNGYYAGRSNTKGNNNAFYGYYSGYRNTTGYDNSFYGLYSGYSTNTGYRNTFQGRSAGYRNTTGRSNTYIGYYAGYNNVTGFSNVFIGNQAGYSETGSNKLYISNSNSSTPLIYGDFGTKNLTVNGGLSIVDGTQQDGYVLTTDANGKASWQPGGGIDLDWTVAGNNMYSNVSGNVGIGNASPQYKLDIKRNFRIDSETNPGRNYRVESTSLQRIYATNDMITTSGGNQEYRVGSNRALIIANNSAQKFFWAHGGTQKVSIGTANTPASIGGANISTYKLFVAGGILTEAIRVRVNWADYVFDPDYELKPLNEVEKHIQEKGHLPNVPSAKEVEAQGIELGDISRIQQEKIEELFLHTIEQEKEINKQKEINKALEDRLAKLETTIEAMNKAKK